MEYSLLAVPLNIALSEGGRHQTVKSKMLEIVAIPLTTPPNSPEMVISVDTNKLCTLIIDLIGPIRTTMKIPELYRQLTWKLLGTLPKRYRRINWVADT